MQNKILLLLIFLCGIAKAQDNSSPIEFTYKIIGTDSLKAYVFFPKDITDNESKPSIAIFHGGGWAMGEPSWGFGYAKNTQNWEWFQFLLNIEFLMKRTLLR